MLGKKSGLDSIRLKAQELSIDLPDEQVPVLLGQVKALGTRLGRLVSDEEFRRLAAN